MHKFDIIFETLKDLRTFAEDHNMPNSLRTIERAEHVALNEVCGINLEDGDDDYDAVMAEIFPEMRKNPA